jgi:hypothetical protein
MTRSRMEKCVGLLCLLVVGGGWLLGPGTPPAFAPLPPCNVCPCREVYVFWQPGQVYAGFGMKQSNTTTSLKCALSNIFTGSPECQLGFPQVDSQCDKWGYVQTLWTCTDPRQGSFNNEVSPVDNGFLYTQTNDLMKCLPGSGGG